MFEQARTADHAVPVHAQPGQTAFRVWVLPVPMEPVSVEGAATMQSRGRASTRRKPFPMKPPRFCRTSLASTPCRMSSEARLRAAAAGETGTTAQFWFFRALSDWASSVSATTNPPLPSVIIWRNDADARRLLRGAVRPLHGFQIAVKSALKSCLPRAGPTSCRRASHISSRVLSASTSRMFSAARAWSPPLAARTACPVRICARRASASGHGPWRCRCCTAARAAASNRSASRSSADMSLHAEVRSRFVRAHPEDMHPDARIYPGRQRSRSQEAKPCTSAVPTGLNQIVGPAGQIVLKLVEAVARGNDLLARLFRPIQGTCLTEQSGWPRRDLSGWNRA